jgi:hypothetical protein
MSFENNRGFQKHGILIPHFDARPWSGFKLKVKIEFVRFFLEPHMGSQVLDRDKTKA